jgi:hypothetical protein
LKLISNFFSPLVSVSEGVEVGWVDGRESRGEVNGCGDGDGEVRSGSTISSSSSLQPEKRRKWRFFNRSIIGKLV